MATREEPCGYWLYFSDREDYDDRCQLVRMMADQLRPFVNTDYLADQSSVPLDFKELKEHVDPDFPLLLYEEPDLALACLGCVMHEIVYGVPDVSEEMLAKQHKFIVRVYGYEKHTTLRNLKAHLLRKFVCIKGTVIRTSNIKPLAMEMPFACKRCASQVVLQLEEGRYRVPTATCQNCRGRAWLPVRSATSTIDWQTIRLQEEVDAKKDSGRVPRTLDCELKSDLVDNCAPGDEVTLCGVVRSVNSDVDRKVTRGAKGKAHSGTLFQVFLDVNSLENSKHLETSQSKGQGLMDFSEKDIFVVQQIYRQPNLFNLVVNSICPGIFGHEIVKAGLTFALFGGCQKFSQDRNKIPIRGDPHVLVVGDPGLGKSQMLQAVNNITPRGVYVCGTYSSSTGLTVSLHREQGSSDYALEAGALVLGDQGCCCIDEFDKMASAEHESLLEAMEQQSISIAKAGIVCSLPARTSVIAAANPVGGRYNRGKTVNENLHMAAPLLSRFDLIFILLDCPNEEHDRLLSEHVMQLHSGSQLPEMLASQTPTGGRGGCSDSLKERLRRQALPPKEWAPLPPPLLRKYIGYARTFVHPKLSAGAKSLLKDFYLELRASHRGDDTTPVTTRQLESLVRLTEARAKIELREEATAEDAQDAIDVMKASLLERGCGGGDDLDKAGFIDFRAASGGGGRISKARQVTTFVNVLNQVAKKKRCSLFSYKDLCAIAQCNGINVSNFTDFVDTLNTQGLLLRKTGGYKLACSEY
eukprot:TRINITY_DN7297_c0_g1_i1.p1 TRINITY_DN7297_c0_g1~~TRINITY_DN7297_c0_g1_i1.p1  ORF type:complete len:753 (-),score=192.85 TRINITY_DN7297_c0_g1_i1:67-2325(-)